MWIPEWDMWFETYVEIDEENEDIKKVTGKSLGEAELSQIMLYNIEINTERVKKRIELSRTILFYCSCSFGCTYSIMSVISHFK